MTTDLPALWINVGILVLTGVMALVAVVQAKAALRDAGEAKTARDEAVDAQKTAAKALDRANLIAQDALDAQRLSMPAPWGTPVRMSSNSHRFRVENTSGRTIVVTKIDSREGGNVYVFIAEPGSVQYGASLFFTAQLGGVPSSAGNAIVLEWHYEDEPQTAHRDERGF